MIPTTAASPGAAQVVPSTLTEAASSGLIRSGDILHVRTTGFLGLAIRRAIGSWGNHDALLVRPEMDLCAGDSQWPHAKCTPLADYDSRILTGNAFVIVYRPTGSTMAHGSLAAAWWIRNCQGRPYDIGAYPRLMLKALLGDLCQWPAGWEWAWYCTEGCRDAWRNGPGLDPWQKTNPTPHTTEKRLLAGAFQLIATFPAPESDSAASDLSITTPTESNQKPSTKHQEPST
jgi:hypothetical protein